MPIQIPMRQNLQIQQFRALILIPISHFLKRRKKEYHQIHLSSQYSRMLGSHALNHRLLKVTTQAVEEGMDGRLSDSSRAELD